MSEEKTGEEKKAEEKKQHYEMIEKWTEEFIEKYRPALIELSKK
ncbi:MAG TPA: hypothetical protein VJ841_03230 [Candidatus Saccharimonadales bacterium]|nr:hypothetical protein [Candidatus Saccharimonadales bacterium]